MNRWSIQEWMSNGKNPHVIALSNFEIPRLKKPKKNETQNILASELIKASVAVCIILNLSKCSNILCFIHSRLIIVFVQNYYLIQ